MERAAGKVGDGIERAERFDAVDRERRRRASFGILGRFPDQGDVVGLELLDVDGKAAVTVVLDDTGAATLSFSTAGNEDGGFSLTYFAEALGRAGQLRDEEEFRVPPARPRPRHTRRREPLGAASATPGSATTRP